MKTIKKDSKFTRTPPKPLTTVYIGNLKYDRDERDIKELFSEFGTVKSVDIVLDPETEKSKGIAFVKMFELKEAQTAIKALNGAQFDGRTLKVSVANDRFAVPTLAKENVKESKDSDMRAIKVMEMKATRPKTPKTLAPKKQGLDVLFNYLNTRK